MTPEDTCNRFNLIVTPEDTCNRFNLIVTPEDTCYQLDLYVTPEDTCYQLDLYVTPEDTFFVSDLLICLFPLPFFVRWSTFKPLHWSNWSLLNIQASVYLVFSLMIYPSSQNLFFFEELKVSVWVWKSARILNAPVWGGANRPLRWMGQIFLDCLCNFIGVSLTWRLINLSRIGYRLCPEKKSRFKVYRVSSLKLGTWFCSEQKLTFDSLFISVLANTASASILFEHTISAP